MDVNRSGVPLMEIVSEPDIRSPEEARQYLTTLRSILRYIGVSTGNMEEGNFRCDANVSIRPMGSSELCTRTEIKNVNSFRSVFSALEYEVERQQRVVEDGGRVVQETRGWVEDRAVTVSQRSKEHAHDYRYFPEPDLPELLPDPAWVAEIRAALPELPAQRRDRFVSQYGLPLYDAGLLSASRSSAEFFEEAINGKADASESRAKRVSNWMLGEVSRLLDDGLAAIDQCRLEPDHLGQLVRPGGVRRPQQLPRQDRASEGLRDGQGTEANRQRRGLRADQRFIRGRAGHPGRHRPEPQGRSGLPRRQGHGLQVPGGPGDADHPRQGQPRRGQQADAAETQQPTKHQREQLSWKPSSTSSR